MDQVPNAKVVGTPTGELWNLVYVAPKSEPPACTPLRVVVFLLVMLVLGILGKSMILPLVDSTFLEISSSLPANWTNLSSWSSWA